MRSAVASQPTFAITTARPPMVSAANVTATSAMPSDAPSAVERERPAASWLNTRNAGPGLITASIQIASTPHISGVKGTMGQIVAERAPRYNFLPHAYPPLERRRLLRTRPRRPRGGARRAGPHHRGGA